MTNELMWAHYAENMRGLCIEYDVKCLLAALNDDEQLVRMTYDEEMPLLTCTGDADVVARRVLARKNHRWSQEREWRLLTHRLNEVYYNDQSCITQIILGPDMDEQLMDEFRSLEGNFNARRIDVDGYKLTVRGFDDPPRFAVV